VTEIPEHLLKRSKERRAALGLPGGEGGEPGDAGASSAASAPGAADAGAGGDAPTGSAVEARPPAAAAARSAAPAPAPPKPPPPLPPNVEAAQRRPKIPFWAMSVLVAMVPWAFVYMNAMQVPEVQDDVLALGEEAYAPCATCHGGAGEGGVGAQLSGGEVLKTFKDPKDMMMWIHLGADGGAREDGTYGDADREGGVRTLDDLSSKMPAFPELSAEELAAVTRYIREEQSGGEPVAEDVDLVAVAEQAIEDAEGGVLPSAGGEADEGDATSQGGGGGASGESTGGSGSGGGESTGGESGGGSGSGTGESTGGGGGGTDGGGSDGGG
jgi:uncharacterized membrane protein YgcG